MGKTTTHILNTYHNGLALKLETKVFFFSLYYLNVSAQLIRSACNFHKVNQGISGRNNQKDSGTSGPKKHHTNVSDGISITAIFICLAIS